MQQFNATNQTTNTQAVNTGSKSYRLECSCSSEYDKSPEVAVFDIDEATAKRIAGLSKVVKKLGLHKVEKFDYRVSYLQYDPEVSPEMSEETGEENELRTELDCLIVSQDEFWFTAYAKHTDVQFSCSKQPIRDLIENFSLDSGGQCTACGESSDSVIGCPDGSEVCQDCFDNGEG